MPSPFPGMDPYLEWSALWPDLHQSLIFCSREALQPQLPPGYYALLGERIILEEPPRFFYPDVSIGREQLKIPTQGGPEAEPGGGVAVAVAVEADEPVEVEAAEEIRQVYLEIRDATGGDVVTVIEFLSPANKAPSNSAHRTYLEKQAEVLRSNANLVEIDLLRVGVHVLAVPDFCLERIRPYDYLVCVQRAARPGIFELYPRTLYQSLPRVRIPLRPEDGDVVLDLQAVFQRCYDHAPYARLVDYGRDPRAPLAPSQAAWAEALLREKGLRTGGSDMP